MIKCSCGERLRIEFDPDQGLIVEHPDGPMQCSGKKWVIFASESDL
jgi:hypothetical protein